MEAGGAICDCCSSREAGVILVVLWLSVLAACGGDVKVRKLHNLSTDKLCTSFCLFGKPRLVAENNQVVPRTTANIIGILCGFLQGKDGPTAET